MFGAPARCDEESMHLAPVPRDLFATWQYTLEHWTQKHTHDTLLGLAAKHHQLAWLATRYREAARCNPHDPIARDRMKSVQRAAALLTFSTSVTRETTPKLARGCTVLLIAAVLSTGLGLWVTAFMRDQQQTTLVSRHP